VNLVLFLIVFTAVYLLVSPGLRWAQLIGTPTFRPDRERWPRDSRPSAAGMRDYDGLALAAAKFWADAVDRIDAARMVISTRGW
jgi:hypothetical protein